MLQRVFISYRHENPEHSRAVRRLGELLRQAKIPIILDQFFLEENPGGPDVGWPKWCEDRANEAACVLIIASEGWFAAYNKTAPPDTGTGAATEADLIRQWLYDERADNTRIRLVFLHEIAADKVPPRLRGWHHFRPFDSDDQLNGLLRWVSQCVGVENPELPMIRWPESIPFRPNLADRAKEEWPAVVELLASRSQHRILLCEGASGLGKSVLVRQAAAYAKKLGIAVALVDFKGGPRDVLGILGQLYLEIGDLLPNFSRQGADKAHLLRGDLRKLRQPVLVIFDSYEDVANNPNIADWLNQQFFTEFETALGVAAIVAGQQVPDYRKAGWRDLVRHLPLEPITEIEHWAPWVDQQYPDFRRKGADLRTVLMYAGGIPFVVSQVCEAISTRSGRHFLQTLEHTQGDTRSQATLTAEFLLASLPEGELQRVRDALDAAALLRWFDDDLLGEVLQIPSEEVRHRSEALNNFSFLERYRKGEEEVCYIYEATRLGWRKKIAGDDPDRFRELSLRAASCFVSDSTPAGRIEWIYHLLCGDPDLGASELEMLDTQWSSSARSDDRYALATALQELEDTQLLQGRARAWSVLWIARTRVMRGEAGELVGLLTEALKLARASGDKSAQVEAMRLEGDVRQAQGDLIAAQAAFEETLAVSRRLVEEDQANAVWQRGLAVALGRMGDVLQAQGKHDLAGRAFEESRAITQQLAERDPSKDGWQRDLAIADGRMALMQLEKGEAPPNWWTPLLSSGGSGEVSNGPGTASFYG